MLIYEEKADDPRCTACGICARVCPPQCIWIELATDARGRPKAKPAGFWIDAAICMSCGFCAEFCPFDAIKMNQAHDDLWTQDRDGDMFYTMEKLLVPVETYARLHPTDHEREEAARQAKEEAKQAAAARRAAAKKAAAEKRKAEAAEKAATKAAQEPSEPDDLKRIEGIGPKMSSVLQAAGIKTFAQLADTTPEQLEQILADADQKLANLADTKTWPRQGKLAASGKWDALEKWQDRLKGGRKA
jgi:formate hydrogenlyase subunit 6/NADH:ubiquinone oxidoreductase subunit I